MDDDHNKEIEAALQQLKLAQSGTGSFSGNRSSRSFGDSGKRRVINGSFKRTSDVKNGTINSAQRRRSSISSVGMKNGNSRTREIRKGSFVGPSRPSENSLSFELQKKSLNQRREKIQSIIQSGRFEGPMDTEELYDTFCGLNGGGVALDGENVIGDASKSEFSRRFVEEGMELKLLDAKIIVRSIQVALEKPAWMRTDTDLHVLRTWLKSFKVFEVIDDASLKRIARALRIRQVEQGQYLYKKGARNNDGMYIIFEGTVTVYSDFGTKPTKLFAGDSIGGASLGNIGKQRQQSVRVDARSIFIQFTCDALKVLEETEPFFPVSTLQNVDALFRPTRRRRSSTMITAAIGQESDDDSSNINFVNTTTKAESISASNEAFVKEVLMKPPHERLESELKVLFKLVSHISVFQTLPAHIGLEVCRYLTLVNLKPMESVPENKLRDAFYLLLTGSVSVYRRDKVSYSLKNIDDEDLFKDSKQWYEFCSKFSMLHEYDAGQHEEEEEAGEIQREPFYHPKLDKLDDVNETKATESSAGEAALSRYMSMRRYKAQMKVSAINSFSRQSFSQKRNSIRCTINQLQPSRFRMIEQERQGMDSFHGKYKRSSIAAIISRVAPDWKIQSDHDDGIQVCKFSEGDYLGGEFVCNCNDPDEKDKHVCGIHVENSMQRKKMKGRRRSLLGRRASLTPGGGVGIISPPEADLDEWSKTGNMETTYRANGPCSFIVLAKEAYQKSLSAFESTRRKKQKQEEVNLTQLFRQSPINRVDDHLLSAETALSKLHFFLQLPNSIRLQICRIGNLETFQTNQVVVKQKDINAQKFYVVLCGSVSVFLNNLVTKEDDASQLPDCGDIRECFGTCVAVLNAGSSFGEFAMLKRNGRQASIIAREPTCILSIHYVDYARAFQLNIDFDRMILKGYQELSQDARSALETSPYERTNEHGVAISKWAQKVHFFKVIPEELMERFCKELRLIHLKDKQVLFRQGDVASDVYLVLSGSVSVHMIRTWESQEVMSKLKLLRKKAKQHRRKTIQRQNEEEQRRIQNIVRTNPIKMRMRRSNTESDLFYQLVQIQTRNNEKAKIQQQRDGKTRRSSYTEEDLAKFEKELDEEADDEDDNDDDDEEEEAGHNAGESSSKGSEKIQRGRRNNILSPMKEFESNMDPAAYLAKFGECVDVAIVGGSLGELGNESSSTSSRWRRKSTAVARGPTELIAISKVRLDKVVRENHSVISAGLIREIIRKSPKERSMDDNATLESLLLRISFIKQISTKDFRLVHSLSQVIEYHSFSTGVPIFVQGQLGDQLYIILEGSVQIRKHHAGVSVSQKKLSFVVNDIKSSSKMKSGKSGGGGGEASWDMALDRHYGKLVVELSAGDSFGETALVMEAPRNASAITVEPCQVLTISKSSYDTILKSFTNLLVFQPTLAQKAVTGEVKGGSIKINKHEKVEGMRSLVNHLAIFRRITQTHGPQALDAICEHLEYQSFATDEILAKRGDFADRIIIILKGSIGVFVKDVSDDVAPMEHDDPNMQQLGTGDLVLETGLALNIPQQVTSKVLERCVGVVLSREHYHQYWPETWKIGGKLHALRQSCTFEKCKLRELAAITHVLTRKSFRRHTIIPTDDQFLVIASGSCELSIHSPKAKPMHLTDVGEFETFGEESCVALRSENLYGSAQVESSLQARNDVDNKLQVIAKSNVELFCVPNSVLIGVISNATLKNMKKIASLKKAWRTAFLSQLKATQSNHHSMDVQNSQLKLRKELVAELQQAADESSSSSLHRRSKKQSSIAEMRNAERTIPSLDIALRQSDKQPHVIRGNVFAGDSWMDVHLKPEAARKRKEVELVHKQKEDEEKKRRSTQVVKFEKKLAFGAQVTSSTTAPKVMQTPMMSSYGRSLSIYGGLNEHLKGNKVYYDDK